MVEKSNQTMYIAIIALVIAVLAIGITYTSEAPPGPMGPEGPQGEAGAVGPAGPTGEVILTPDAPTYGTIQGTVLSAKGNPVANAAVEVEGQSVSATTDANGVFELEDVEPGYAYVYVNAPSEDYLDEIGRASCRERV